jgi:predicted RNA methylase
MRVAATAKAGYYPTPTSIVAFLVSKLEYQPKAALLDPCCGTGEALSRFAAIVGGSSTGLELDAERAALARSRLSSLHHGDALAHDARGFSLLFLNPPYDSDAGERLELRFLRHFTPALVTGGLLVFVIPEYILDEVCPHLEHHFNRLGVYRFPADEYEAFRQVIVVGHRRDPRQPAGVLPDVSALETMPRLEVRAAREPLIARRNISESDLMLEAASSPLWVDLWEKTTPANADFRPLAPVRPGHLALLVAAGMLNGVIVEAEGQRLLVRGFTEKVERTEQTEDRTVMRENFVGGIVALDLSSGEEVVIK